MKKDPSQYITTRANGTVRIQTINEEPSKTQQQFGPECDINNIMEKYHKTGQVTHLAQFRGNYADFTEITDFHSMQDTVAYARSAFELLPAELRLRFKNDPGELLNFLQDNKNYEEALKLGLLDKDKISNFKTNEQTQTNEPKTKTKKNTNTVQPVANDE